jgi:hypothetical protein
MALFVISYDLRKARQYQRLVQQLEKWQAVRVLDSLWLANLNGTALKVRDVLRPLLDAEDGLAIIELKAGSMWATAGVQPAGLTWLKTQLPSAPKAMTGGTTSDAS